MIEAWLNEAGVKGGPKANFKKWVLNDQQLHKLPRWYFRTPVKYLSDGFKAATLDMAFPFQALIGDNIDDEAPILARLELVKQQYIDDLLVFFRKYGFIVPPETVNATLIAFWAGDTNPKEENKSYQGMRIHILNVVLTIKYRHLNLPTSIDPVLAGLKLEQKELETRIDALTIYVGGAEFDALEQSEKDVLTAQLAAMNNYNAALLTRITNY